MEDCEILGIILDFIGDVLFGSDSSDYDYDSTSTSNYG
ncbi:uncharacterized protein LOC111518787 [Drosophila willistoni]|nr:uncharacterized protein LOC111518787 [Drosophila willistoni]